jgi:hypothetical protein
MARSPAKSVAVAPSSTVRSLSVWAAGQALRLNIRLPKVSVSSSPTAKLGLDEGIADEFAKVRQIILSVGRDCPSQVFMADKRHARSPAMNPVISAFASSIDSSQRTSQREFAMEKTVATARPPESIAGPDHTAATGTPVPFIVKLHDN